MKWSVDDDKLYEDALKEFPEEVENRWEKIASRLPGKSPEDVKAHYNALFVDSLISVFDFPDNEAKADSINNPIDHDESTETSIHSCEISSRPSSRVVNDDGPRWTEEEHRLFLKGLNEYGKGQLTEIAKYVVRSRTPTQVGSHAHRYYKRLNINCGAITLQPIRVHRRGRYNMTATNAGGAIEPSPTNLPGQGGKNPADAINGGSMEPSSTNFSSQGGSISIDAVNNGAMEPPPTNLPSQGGNNPTDVVNSGEMEPSPTNLPNEGGNNPADAVTSGEKKPSPTNLPSQEGPHNF
ncbi:transcription factor SRM1-like [Olea europaea var. sylvestris]|uniref:Transcription factor DIVARICATA-like n=1 Tax=Olea europaea subsp. europaea TaxID=158383 RepID=A0A8S0TK78_OLEEU|nr:transcription factor SRM1-like [Olea europaea var. sylvestris]CAA3005201.1 transcription factor DIVARICATA-like [Olea europaea subsp. europaea]